MIGRNGVGLDVGEGNYNQDTLYEKKVSIKGEKYLTLGFLQICLVDSSHMVEGSMFCPIPLGEDSGNTQLVSGLFSLWFFLCAVSVVCVFYKISHTSEYNTNTVGS